MSIGENVKYMRTKNKMTQKELAEKVGVNKSMISMLERGTKTLTLPLALEMANVLKCDVIDLASSKRDDA